MNSTYVFMITDINHDMLRIITAMHITANITICYRDLTLLLTTPLLYITTYITTNTTTITTTTTTTTNNNNHDIEN